MDLLQTVLLAAVMFVATNADDLLLLMVFFAQPGSSMRQIVAGQLAGIAALTAASIAAALFAMTAPHNWLPWLGIVPLALGVRWLGKREDPDAPTVAAKWWAIAGVTIANGADNLGVYIPAFTLQTPPQIVTTSTVFLLATFVWCLLARTALRHPVWQPRISRVLRWVGPYILIGIGLWIILHHPWFRMFQIS
ncbi:MAG: cadmium resistance transporter [Nibricoccus sp.]